MIVGSDTTINGELSVQGIVTSGIECSDAIIADGNISADGSVSSNGGIVANDCSIKVKNSSDDDVVVISSSGNITASTFQGATTTTVSGIPIKRQVYISPTSFTLSSKRGVSAATDGVSAAINIVAFNEDGTGRVASGNINWTSTGDLNIAGGFAADSGEFSDTVSCVGIYSSDGGEISGTLSIKDGGNLYLYDFNNDATITMSSEDGEIYASSGIFIHYKSGSVTDTNGINTSGLSLIHRTTSSGTITEKIIQVDNSEAYINLRAYSKTGDTYQSGWPITTAVADYAAVPAGKVVSLTIEDLKSLLNSSDSAYSTKRQKWAILLTRQYN